MNATNLLTEITRAFPEAPHPDDAALLSPTTAASPAARHIQAALSGRAWPSVPDDVLHEHVASLPLLSPVGFRYYLPAFLSATVREPAQPSSESLLSSLTLPIGVVGPTLTQLLAHFEAGGPPLAPTLHDLMQQQLSQTNQALHHFIACSSRLSPAQGKTICQFLTYLSKQGGAVGSSQQPALALERYWFQFA